jgi:hypothetical protein
MEVRETCDIFMSQLDKNNTGFINENQFVANVKREFRPTELKELLNFDLIPVEVLDEVNMQPSLAGSRINLRNDNVSNFLILVKIIKILDKDLINP